MIEKPHISTSELGILSCESIADYHAELEHIGSSMLEVYKLSPARFFAMFVDRSLPRPPSTPPQILGNLTHNLVLQPELFDQTYLVAEGCKARRGKVWDAVDQIAAEAGQQAVLPDQVDLAKAMAAAVLAHPIGRKLLRETPGVAEQSIRWTDPSGVKCKCRPDYLISDPDFGQVLCIEVKTSASPDPDGFAKQLVNFGYHRQAGHYCAGCGSIHDRPNRFIFVVVGNQPPHDVFAYLCSEVVIRAAELENTETLCRVATSRETNVWRLPGQDKLQTLELPAWARSKANEYE